MFRIKCNRFEMYQRLFVVNKIDSNLNSRTYVFFDTKYTNTHLKLLNVGSSPRPEMNYFKTSHFEFSIVFFKGIIKQAEF